MSTEFSARDWLVSYFNNGARWLRGDGRHDPQGSRERGAAEELRRVLPWSWITAVTTGYPVHPVVMRQVFLGDVSTLCAVGDLLSRLPGLSDRLRSRLRDPNRYVACEAELLVGLLLTDAGASVVHELLQPAGRGPDWVARWPEGEVAFEVKHPERSDAAKRAERVECEFLWALQRMLHIPNEPLRITQRLEPEFVDACARPELDMATIEREARAVAGLIGAVAARMSTDLMLSVPSVGRFRIERGATPPARFDVSGYGTDPDGEREIGKVRSALREAAKQLRNVPLPGIVALHLGHDALVANYQDQIMEMLVRESWAASVEGVWLIDCLNRRLESENRLLVRPGARERLAWLGGRLRSTVVG